MVGHTALHNANTGIWFAQDLPTEEEEDVDSRDGTVPRDRTRSVFTRDLSRIDLSRDVCTLYSPGDPRYGTRDPMVGGNVKLIVVSVAGTWTGWRQTRMT